MAHRLILGANEAGNVGFDLDLLLRSRLLLAATSGGGKSETIRKICELCAGKVQVILLDPEGEFAGMRASLPFVLAGPGGDTQASVKTAALLAQRLLELNASAICDIYELPPSQRHEFVRDFLVAMVDAPKKLWHPVLVIVDEAHVYAPEKGETPSIASDAMADMASRGRKRGFCLVMATQRLARLNNNTAALCENVLVGRTGQIDQERAAKLLNIVGSNARGEFGKTIGRVKDGQFFAWGRAFGLDEPTLFQVERASGAMTAKTPGFTPPPPPAAIRDLLPQLADLPQEADRKAQSEETMRAELAAAKKRIHELETNKPSIDEETVKMLKEKLDELSGQIGAIEQNVERYKAQLAKARRIAESLVTTLSEEEADKLATEFLLPREKEIRQTLVSPAVSSRPAASRPAAKPPRDGEAITGPEQRILNALAWMEAVGVEEPEQPAVAFLAGYTYGSGGYNNPRGRLRQRGLIEYLPSDRLKLTADGKSNAQYPDIDPTNAALHEAIRSRLPGPEVRILDVLLKHYPKAVDATRLAESSGYTPGSGGFNNPRGRLKTLGLIEYPSPGMVIAKPLLFPERSRS